MIFLFPWKVDGNEEMAETWYWVFHLTYFQMCTSASCIHNDEGAFGFYFAFKKVQVCVCFSGLMLYTKPDKPSGKFVITCLIVFSSSVVIL